MKKFVSVLLCLVLGAFSLSAVTSCIPSVENDNEKLNIVTTVFPEYEWTKAVLGDNADNANITLLLDNGVDMHSYQPTAKDIINISTCDMLVYVGGESDRWIEDILKDAKNKDMAVINLIDVLGDSVKEEETVDGMQGDSDHDADHDHEDEAELDEHVWLSLKNAKLFCSEIAGKLAKIDSDNAEKYAENAEIYIEKLTELDLRYQDTVDSASKDTLIFADRFPFLYLVSDYGIDYYAAFPGCSADTNANFETIIFLSKKLDELDLSSVLVIDSANGKIADTVVENTKNKNKKILVMNSMQSVTSYDIENGVTYLSVMESNLSVIKTALQ